MEKSVEQKLRECREVIIQGMEKTIQHKMVYMFLKDRRKESDTRQFSVNGKDGIIKIEFADHEHAKAFYDEANFVDKILIRPFNIYFNLTLTEEEMKKYYLEGISEDNQRRLFEECRKIGICKLYTNYGSGPRGKLKPNGVLSFIRRQPIPEADFQRLADNLKALGIKIHNYIHEKGLLKCSINLINFHTAEYSQEETLIHKQAEEKARQLIKEVGIEAESSLTVIVKKKESNERAQQKVAITAIIEYNDVEQTMRAFQKMRDFLVNRGETKAVLFFHNEENNSFLSLFTAGLQKHTELTEKQFENKLLQDFRLINKNVIQVNVYHVQYNDTYIGRVYLRSEQDGKDFIVDYTSKRKDIFKHYKDQNTTIAFNINVDTKTLRKIKQAERRAKETEEKIKKSNEVSKRQSLRPSNAFPINGLTSIPMGIGPSIVMPNLHGGALPMGPISAPTAKYPLGLASISVGGLKPQALPGMVNPIPGFPPSTADSIRLRIKHILKDKANFVNSNQDTAKRLLSEPLKFMIEEAGVSNSQSGALCNLILTEDDVNSVMRQLEFPHELQARINQIKH